MEPATQREILREAAAAWHDRVHREKVAEDTRSEFARWLAESPGNRAAYEEIDRTWAKLKSAAYDPQILALRHEAALRLTRRTSRRVRPLVWVTAAVILIVVGTGLATLSERSSGGRSLVAAMSDVFHPRTDGRYATATGERLTVTLQDGSQLTLNTQTELQVAFTPEERKVHLVRGQALFEVAKDPGRPFVVTAHNRRFVAVGTAFDVRLAGTRIELTMVEGTVRVERTANAGAIANSVPPATPASTGRSSVGAADAPVEALPRAALPMISVTAGEQLTVDDNSHDHVRSTDAERVTSWRRGQVIFENTRLADAIAELNRYSETKIELADPALADLRLSGGFATGRPTVFVEAVTSYFPVQVVRSDDRAVILSARQ
ncbi:MAG: FecR domain-containing protein [Gammaproteobacteria bacterium]